MATAESRKAILTSRYPGRQPRGGCQVSQRIAFRCAARSQFWTPSNVIKMAIIARVLQPMRIELNYQAETIEEAICQTIVAYLGKGMPPREILDQLIERGFVRDPGNNALEVVVQRLGEMAEKMRRDQGL